MTVFQNRRSFLAALGAAVATALGFKRRKPTAGHGERFVTDSSVPEWRRYGRIASRTDTTITVDWDA
jgi:hypothetical protein